MDFFSVFLVGLALSMDCFAVSLAAGAAAKKIMPLNALKIAFLFGFFQALMPFIGWLAGVQFIEVIGPFDHWIAFLLLAMIGAKMVLESRQKCEGKAMDYFGSRTILVLALATSVDALAVGLSLALTGTDIFIAVLLIGIVSFAVSLAGVSFGKKAGRLLKSRAELLGGIILIAIGLRILLEHLA